MAYSKRRTPSGSEAPKDQRSERGPQAAAITIGDELEYRIARLFIFMGYFVRRARPILTAGALAQATDLDVVALRYVEPFRRQLITLECKSGAEGPLDRVFWLGGVKNFVKADEAFLVRKVTKWNIKDFAKDVGVQIWDLNKIAELESVYKVSNDEWPGISDRDYYKKEIDNWNKTLKSARNLWELQFTLLTEVQFGDPFPGLNFLLYHLRLLTRSYATEPSNSFIRFIIAETLSQTVMFLMRIAEFAFDLPQGDRTGFIEKGLTYGSVDPKFADRILNSALNLTKQTVFHLSNKNVEIDPTFFQLHAPPSTAEVVKAIDYILKYYSASLTFPQITDLLLHEVFVKQNRDKGWLKRIFSVSDLPVRVGLTRDFLKLLTEAGACPVYVWNSISTAAQENGSKKSGLFSSHTGDVEQLELPNTSRNLSDVSASEKH
jgi:hypothetical protein